MQPALTLVRWKSSGRFEFDAGTSDSPVGKPTLGCKYKLLTEGSRHELLSAVVGRSVWLPQNLYNSHQRSFAESSQSDVWIYQQDDAKSRISDFISASDKSRRNYLQGVHLSDGIRAIYDVALVFVF